MYRLFKIRYVLIIFVILYFRKKWKYNYRILKEKCDDLRRLCLVKVLILCVGLYVKVIEIYFRYVGFIKYVIYLFF